MWEKGKSGNPGGRPPIPDELKTKLRAGAADSFDFWIKTLSELDEEGKPAKWEHRNKAAENIVAYAYGKPKELIDMEHSGKIEGFTITVARKLDEPAGD